jgi:hypothetical protein
MPSMEQQLEHQRRVSSSSAGGSASASQLQQQPPHMPAAGQQQMATPQRPDSLPPLAGRVSGAASAAASGAASAAFTTASSGDKATAQQRARQMLGKPPLPSKTGALGVGAGTLAGLVRKTQSIEESQFATDSAVIEAGQCKFPSGRPRLDRAWFQRLNLTHDDALKVCL